MALTGITVFLSAFLLFLVQPIIAKLILPRFGGSVAVWATCLVFFQAALLLGYAFAHHLVRRDRSRALRLTHIVLLLGSLALLPIVPVTPWPGRRSGRPGAADPAAAAADHRLAVHAAGHDQPAAAGLASPARPPAATRTGCSRCRTWPRWPRCWPTRG